MKYDLLSSYLKTINTQIITLTFTKIESILGFSLPSSAYQYPAWWANGGTAQATGWMSAGYRVFDVDINGKQVTFCLACRASYPGL